ncbi:MAG: helix-turn-helix domain-containing protein [Candidatus Gastranaerophilales bacterium]|nr:helix-turn-helix domain-containing protein [Candidatus Gastranaerophilales bacterium]
MGMRKIRNNIGRKIKALRLEKGLSQEKLAEKIDMSREHISCIERGKNLASIETLYIIAKYFGIDIKDFFNEE